MELTTGWELTATSPGACAGPEELDADDTDWHPATVPGTVAAAIEHADRDLDAEDWWFRCRFAVANDDGADPVLELDGRATECEVFVNRHRVLRSASMWRAHAVEIGEVVSPGADNELTIVCRALAPLLERRRRPRARWRTRVVNHGHLRPGRPPGRATRAMCALG